jgi:hypothetical protein
VVLERPAIETLGAGHEEVRDLFQQYVLATDPGPRWLVAQDVFILLDIHSRLEKEVFYPAFEQESGASGIPLVAAFRSPGVPAP